MKIILLFLLATVVCFAFVFLFDFLSKKLFENDHEVLGAILTLFYVLTLFAFPILAVSTIGITIFVLV